MECLGEREQSLAVLGIKIIEHFFSVTTAGKSHLKVLSLIKCDSLGERAVSPPAQESLPVGERQQLTQGARKWVAGCLGQGSRDHTRHEKDGSPIPDV